MLCLGFCWFLIIRLVGMLNSVVCFFISLFVVVLLVIHVYCRLFALFC